MTRQTERSPQEPPIDDQELPEPGGISRRGLLTSVSLAGLGAAVGATLPPILVSNRHFDPVGPSAGGSRIGRCSPALRSQPLDYPGKEKRLVVLGERPQARGNQWTNGGAGCAEWTGVPLSEVLQAAGLKDTANYTAHDGADRDLILDYLATHHPPKAPARAGGQVQEPIRAATGDP
ncbi:molybdopterin-dependent oxidoreductase [Microvirga makkahensis]|nr:molybdopterin-dependent oxidoreductase [Microvirga makkahensis]